MLAFVKDVWSKLVPKDPKWRIVFFLAFGTVAGLLAYSMGEQVVQLLQGKLAY